MEVRKTVTVLFADVTGSTALGERLDPESLRALMTRYFDEMRTIAERHGGTVEKFIGDAVMAVFGVPAVHEDDALRAVTAASHMLEMLASLNAELERDWGARLGIRIGVNTGEVVAGDPSSGQTFVTGDAVNVAARLEQAAEPGEVLIGEPTLRLVRDAVDVKPLDPLELKGKSGRIPAFRVLDVRPGAAPFARRLDSPLVGRESDLARLRAALDEAVAFGACRLVTVVGDAGLGKTRLVGEVVDRERERARTLWARCLPYGEGITFWPVAEVVRAAAGIGESDLVDEARSKLHDLVADLEDGNEVADGVAGAIGLGGDVELRETFWALRRLLESLARERPLIVVFEDIHWAEPSFLDLVQYVRDFSTQAPLLVLCTARPSLRETRPDWERLGELVALEPLDEEQCDRLIDNLLGRAGLTGPVRDRIAEAAEGNPLFVEEMLRMLIDEGRLERDDGRWVARGDLMRIAVPSTISALLSARLDQLEAGERALIQRAAVAGKVFWWGAVSDLSPEDERPGIGSQLQTLVRKELVRPDRSGFAGEDAFRFSHILVRDAAYESLPKRARAELHERFASWLDRKVGDRIAEFDEIVGYHLEQAFRYHEQLGPVDEAARVVADRASERLAATGRRALARWDISAAVNLLERAVGLREPSDPRRLELLPDLGAALTQRDVHRADEVLTEAVEAARAAGDARLEARAGIRRVVVRLLRDPEVSQSASLHDAEEYASQFDAWNDDLGMAEARNTIGTIRFWQGSIVEAEANLESAMAHARRAGDRRQETESLHWLALAAAEGPMPVEDGLRRFDDIVEAHPGDRRVQIDVDRARASLEAMGGRFERAREIAARATASARELGDENTSVGVLRSAGVVELLAGDPAAAEIHLRAAYETAERIGDLGHLASVAPDLGNVVYEQARYDEALHLAETGERLTIVGDLDAGVRWRQLKAMALARLGGFDEATALATEAVDMVSGTENLDLHAHALLGLVEVHRLAGRPAEAASAAREAIALYRRKGHVVGERRLTEQLAELDG